MSIRPAHDVYHLLVGNPENRRVTFFQQALERFGLAPAKVIAYSDLLNSNNSLKGVLHAELDRATSAQQSVNLRIESPGENFEVEKRLIAQGADLLDKQSTASRISSQAAQRMVADRGRIRYPAQWYAGFRKVMQQLGNVLADHPSVDVYNAPDEIPVMFDKRLTHRRLQNAGVATPQALPDVSCYGELKSRMQAAGWNRVFVKLACGSSASGVVALYVGDKQVRAVTPMEMVGSGSRTKFYNNLKLSIYHRENQIQRVVDYLLNEGAHVEQWLPKSTMAGLGFDLRVVAIAGEAAHVVMRSSSGPITNLHLGNKRGDIVLLKQRMGEQKWNEIDRIVARAARAFPSSLYIGLDILLGPRDSNPVVLEANAFGDLLPGVLFHGWTTYEAQVEAKLSMINIPGHAISREIA